MASFVETLQKLGPMRLGIMGITLAAFVGFFFLVSARLSTPEMGLLYADLDMADGAQIVSKLESQGAQVQLRGNGTQIYVPLDQVARLRMSMAEEGLPSGGSVGYEIFDRSDILGTTSFVQDLNKVRALEGELSRTIRSLTGVMNARVHLVLPKKELFNQDKATPTASIVLRMKGGLRLSAAQVHAIQHLVASAVPNLSPGSISLIDDKGTLLSRGEGPEGAMSASLEEARRTYEGNMARTIEMLLERSVGADKVRAEVSVEMDAERQTTNAEEFNPDQQVIRSTQNVTEDNASTEASGGGQAVTAQSSLPNAPKANQGGAGGNNGSNAKRAEETINYEISKTMRTTIKETGGIKRLSIAVLVDGTYQDVGGKQTYTPRTTQDIEQLVKLVKTAVGFKEDRGDKVEVINLPFVNAAAGNDAPPQTGMLGLATQEWIRIGESIFLGIITLLALFMVVKPIIGRLLEQPAANNNVGGDTPLALPGGGPVQQQAALGAPAQARQAALGQAPSSAPDAPNEAMLEIEKIAGRVKASTVNKIEEIIDQRPEEAVAIIRTWMRQEA